MYSTIPNHAIARVFAHNAPRRVPVGAGFLVSPRYLLTCAHVIEDALNLNERAIDAPTQIIECDFPLLPKHAPLKARVVRWLPICDQPTPGAPEDIALLEIAPETPLPAEARPIDLLTLPDGHYAKRAFRAYGLTECMGEDGEWAGGTLDDLVASGRVQLRHEVGRRAIEHGFSGAAVWDDREEAALGMIVAIRGRDEFASAYMIPAALLLDACPEIEPARRALNPYKGLQAFEEADAPYFFGRETLIGEFEQKLNAAPLLAVLGPSGSGKSSAVFAGLLPRLKAADSGLLVVTMRPGDEPVKALSKQLIPLLEPELQGTERRTERNKLSAALLANENTLADVLEDVLEKQRASSLLLVVDQFEELYTPGEMTEERRRFVELLLDALACAERRSACAFGLLIALRSDFFDRTNSVPELSQAISAHHHLVPAMTDAELRRAIAEPARAAGQPLDDIAVDALLEQAAGRDGILPLLEFALTEIWNGLAKGVDALETLTRIGGVGGALAQKAQAIFETLPPEEQQIARRAFLTMTRLGEGAKDTRRRVALSDLIPRDSDPAQTHRALQPFATHDVRLLTLSDNAAEITHEALLEQWENLKAWIEASRADLRFRDRLRDAARHWDEIGRKAGALWQTPDLEQLIAFERRAGAELTQFEFDFFRAAKWRKRRARLTTFAVMLVLAGLAAASTFGLLRAQEAERNAQLEKDAALLEQKRAQKQQRMAELAEDRAVRQKELALKAINSLTYELADELVKLPRAKQIVARILESNVALLDRIYALEPDTPRAQREKGSNLSRTGDVWLLLGNTDKALQAYQQSLEIARWLASADQANTRRQRDLWVSYNKLGEVQMQLGDTQAALTQHQQGLEVAQRLVETDPANVQAKRDLSISYNLLSDMQARLGDTDAALRSYQQSSEILQQLAAADPANNEAQRDLSVSYERLGDIQSQRGDTDAALYAYQQSLAIRERLAADDPANTQAQRDLSVSYERLGNIQSQHGDTDAALRAYQQSLKIFERLAADDPANTEAQRDLSINYNNLGDIYIQHGDTDVALRAYQQSLAIRERLAEDDPANTEAQRDLSISYNKLARIEEALGHLEKTISLYEKGLMITQDLLVKDSQNHWLQYDVLEFQGALLRLQGDEQFYNHNVQTAFELYQRALTLSQQVTESDHTNLNAQRDVVIACYKLGQAQEALKQTEGALRWYQQALPIAERLAKDSANAQAQNDLKWLQNAIKRVQETPEEKPAAALQLELQASQAAYRVGDLLQLAVTPSQPCYLTIFDFAVDGVVTRIFPNAFVTDNLLQAGKTYTIPAESDKFDFAVTGPAGTERLRAVCTAESVELLAEKFNDDAFGRFEGGAEAFEAALDQQLAALPAGSFAAAALEIRVMPAP